MPFVSFACFVVKKGRTERLQIFHKPGCEAAAKIPPKNLVEYATKRDAIRDGKAPCQECRP